jgi:hypothetical protein
MTSMRKAALAAITVLIIGSATASFCESYRGLFLWAEHHGLRGIWAAGFPLQVDVFIAVGELALFVALADSWPFRSRVAAWGVTVLGLAVSVGGNVGHIAGHDLASRLTAAVPPLAAASALAVGLGVLKRVVAARQKAGSRGALARPAATGATPRSVTATRQRKAPRPRQARVSDADMEARALAELSRQPAISGADLGRAIGASPRTGQRMLSRLNGRGSESHVT